MAEDIGKSFDETVQKALKAIEQQRADTKRTLARVADDLEKAYFRKDWEAIKAEIAVLRHVATSD